MYPNIRPVTNKYLAQKYFVKAQADHEKNVKSLFLYLFNTIKL
jgi:hypothetical protein